MATGDRSAEYRHDRPAVRASATAAAATVRSLEREPRERTPKGSRSEESRGACAVGSWRAFMRGHDTPAVRPNQGGSNLVSTSFNLARRVANGHRSPHKEDPMKRILIVAASCALLVSAASAQEFGPWSAPVNLGSTINSAA